MPITAIHDTAAELSRLYPLKEGICELLIEISDKDDDYSNVKYPSFANLLEDISNKSYVERAVYVEESDDGKSKLVYKTKLMKLDKIYSVVFDGEWYKLKKTTEGVEIARFVGDQNVKKI